MNLFFRTFSLISLLFLSSTNTFTKDLTLEEIFISKKGPSSIEEIKVLNKRCDELGLALKFKLSEKNTRIAMLKAENTPEIKNKRGIIPQALLEIPQNILEGIYNKFVRSNPYSSIKATVEVITPASGLNVAEERALKKKIEINRKNTEMILGNAVKSENTPCIGIAGSGGGLRAAYWNLGALKMLAEHNLLDSITYIAGVSGSCWPMYYILEGTPINIFYENFISRTTRGILNQTVAELAASAQNWIASSAEYLLRKLIFRENPSIIDIYGFLLGQLMFNKKDRKNSMEVFFHTLSGSSQEEQFPIPILTAIVPYDQENKYLWIEITPHTVGNIRSDLNTLDNPVGGRIPSQFYGRKCFEGKSINSSPPLPFWFFSGLTASAPSLSFNELYEEIKRNILEMLKSGKFFVWPSAKNEESAADQDSTEKANHLSRYACKFLFDMIENAKPIPNFLGTIRPFATYINNFMVGIPEFRYHDQERNAVVDAGIKNNLPIPSLLDRNCDIIIILDASDYGIQYGSELKKAEMDAKKHGLPFPKIEYKDIEKRSYSIFDDGPRSNAPVIFYVPIVKNNRYDKSYDPREYFGWRKHLNTFNFKYKKEEAEKLAGLSACAISEMKDHLIKTIQELIVRKEAYKISRDERNLNSTYLYSKKQQ